MEASLPPSSRLSHRLLAFLEDHFKTRDDLSSLPSLVARLKSECCDLDRHLLRLNKNLSAASYDWISRSNDVRTTLHQLDPTLNPPSGSIENARRAQRILGMELPLLAKGVSRICMVRRYAETTLKLEALVGDLEDATLSLMNQTSKHNLSRESVTIDSGQKLEKLLLAIKAMKEIENILMSVANSRPHWSHLLMAVDWRVENALAMLRPQALTDHRNLLASLGWPPSLSASKTEGKCLEIPNPLLLMYGEKKERYSQSFLALCALQHLQTQRVVRHHDFLRCQKAYNLSNSTDMCKQTCPEHGLWSIDELVHPIASRIEYHFCRWSDEPKLIFALVYKITRDFLDGVDNVLQPLIDKAMLTGCSAKEAWISAMVKMLSKYLERQIFPAFAERYDNRDTHLEVNSSWLHLMDLMISFDKRMQVLATPLVGTFTQFERLSRSLSVLSIFDEHSDWLEMWADIELKDAEEKLKSEIEDGRSWLMDIGQQDEGLMEGADSFLLSTRDDYKAPLIADTVVRSAWAMIERGLSLPSKPITMQFIRSSAILFLNHFFIILLQRSQHMDFMTAVIEDCALIRVIGSVNIARYCESILHEWGENVRLLDMTVANDNQPNCSFFEDEIMFLVKLETDCLVEIVSLILFQFNDLCWEYIHNANWWEEQMIETENMILEERNLSLSPGFIDALEMLRDRMKILRLNLNSKDFLDLWRGIADGLDHFIFSSIPLNNVKFSRQGVDQFKFDMRSLFSIFSLFCARPEAFFPCTCDSLKLLAMDWKDADFLLKVVSEDGKRSEKCLRYHGLFHLSVAQAERILRNRKFGNL